MFLNIITPCVKPHNLDTISQSINIPRQNYRWLVIFDLDEMPTNLPSNCEAYLSRNPHPLPGTTSRGDWQRNFGIDLVEDGWLYFNDDDTTLHPELWSNLHSLDEHDFISFCQAWNNGILRLRGDVIEVGQIDSHNFIASRELIANTRWRLDVYETDGFFAKEVFNSAKNPVFIPKILSIFNTLDNTRYVITGKDIEDFLLQENSPLIAFSIDEMWDLCEKTQSVEMNSHAYDPESPIVVGYKNGNKFILLGHEIVMNAKRLNKTQVFGRTIEIEKAPNFIKNIFL